MSAASFRPTPSAALGCVLVVAALAAAALLLDQPLWGGSISRWLGVEVFKLALQFLLITVLGGGVFAYFAARREEQAKAEVRIAELQALDRDLGAAYRSTKRVKRSMRAKLRRDGVSAAEIDNQSFQDAMEEILDAQIATEEVREEMAIRRDLVDDPTIENLGFALRYSARYLHDVYEDYERGRVKLRGGAFVIDKSTPNLRNFLLHDPLSPELKATLAKARDARSPLAERFRLLETLDASREATDTHGRRQGAVAMEFFRLSSAQIRAQLAAALRARPYRTGP